MCAKVTTLRLPSDEPGLMPPPMRKGLHDTELPIYEDPSQLVEGLLFIYISRSFGLVILLVAGMLVAPCRLLYGQSMSQGPAPYTPSPFAATPTASQQQALQNATDAQNQVIQNVITPQMQQAIQNHQQSSAGNYRSWQDIITNGLSGSNDAMPLQTQADRLSTTSIANKKSRLVTVPFTDRSGNIHSVQGVRRDYHPHVVR